MCLVRNGFLQFLDHKNYLITNQDHLMEYRNVCNYKDQELLDLPSDVCTPHRTYLFEKYNFIFLY